MKFSGILVVCACMVGGCTPSYSPNTYASNAVQLANKVDPGMIVGFREVKISANGTIGAVTGGAAGGLLGSEYTNSPLLTVAGTAFGAAVGHTVDRAVGDSTGWEYIVRKGNGELVSVTQREQTPIPLGQKVLVINGPQARVVPDYSVAAKEPTPAKDKPVTAAEKPVQVEVVLSLPPGMTVQSAAGAKVSSVALPADSATPSLPEQPRTYQNQASADKNAPISTTGLPPITVSPSALPQESALNAGEATSVPASANAVTAASQDAMATAPSGAVVGQTIEPEATPKKTTLP